ncbi:MAG: transcriptional repressor NrdR [Candidatus Zixiibacteriota bacterium]|nr:MAG: transcriptional repressor NrdR [candidate division Zixibacteria bacterium]
MICPACKADGDKVIDSRPAADGRAIRRRRECLACGKRFTTYEQVESPGPEVIKKDGRREPFDGDKIYGSLRIVVKNRPVSNERLQAVVSDITAKIKNEYSGGISTAQIGELVLNELLKLDEVSYVRFASAHKRFSDKDEFITSLKALPRSLQVIKSNGRYEPFKREKLISSLSIALRKRPVSQRKIENAVDQIINKLKNRDEVSSSELGTMLMNLLREIDEVAYIRYASVYRKFQDVSEFTKEVESLSEEEKLER